MNSEVRVSIIIPIHNDGAYLHGALASAAAQTLEQIEVICVDDASTDDSLAIAEEFTAKDPRFRVLHLEQNSSASQARKDGVAVSTGAYLMFLDGDDELVPNACEIAFAAIEKLGTDMVQFDTEIVNCAGMPQSRIDANQRLLAPHMGRVEASGSDGLVDACWRERRFGFSLWNKIYKGDLCRAAFAKVEDGAFPKGQDLYAFFLIAWHARSYAGIDARLYRYHFGRGATGGRLSLGAFERLLSQRRVVVALRRFAEAEGASARLDGVIEGIERHFLNECADKWDTDLAAGQELPAFDRLVGTWGLEAPLCRLAERHWWDPASALARLSGFDRFRCAPRSQDDGPLTVAYCYRSISNGGAQRVAAELCNMWARAKDAQGNPCYRVVLVTDDAPAESEYALDDAVARAYLPAREQSAGVGYTARCQAWQRILDEHHIDVVVYGLWVDACSTWDVLSIKGHVSHPACILHCHSFTMQPYCHEGDTSLRLTYLYGLCDGVVVLSECDLAFVRCFNGNAHHLINPVDYLSERREDVPREPDSIIWVGRVSKEKQPLDLVHMMQAVVQQVPSARLYIVGDGDAQLMGELEREIVRCGLEQNVRLVGFTLDVAAWYQRASVFVCTSAYEGFPMMLGEALSYGLPVVMYDLPWLTYVRDGRGIRTVGPGRYDLLAQEVVQLLENSAELEQLGMEGRALVDDLLQVDLLARWQEVFDGIDPAVAAPRGDSDERILFQYLTEYQAAVKASLKEQRNDAERRLADAFRTSELVNQITARIDLRNLGADENDLELIDATDEFLRVNEMSWLKTGGHGRTLESSTGEVTVRVHIMGAGTLEVALRGRSVMGEDGERVPYWIDFTSLEVDGEQLLDGHRLVWHDRPCKLTRGVADGDVVTIHAVWRHASDGERDKFEAEKAAFYASPAWKVGRVVSWLPRKLRGLLGGAR